MRYILMNRVIRLPIVFWVVVLALLFTAKFTWAEPYKADAGRHDVEALLFEVTDDARERSIPLKVYRPKETDAPLPVVLISHGLGGTREGLSYLANHWASHGYACVVMQHHGSDDAVWRNVPARDRLKAMRKAAKTHSNALNRAKDTTFVLDQIESANGKAQGPLHGSYNMDQVAIAGHSFGGWTCLAAGGMQMPTGQSFADKRIKCIIPLSSPSVSAKKLRERVYQPIQIPSLHMTGTLDTSAINNTTPADRRIPFDYSPSTADGGAPKYLIFFDGADHMTFSGETRRALRGKVAPEDNKAFHNIILQSTTAFLDCYLLGNNGAKGWLNEGGFAELVGDRGTVEMDVSRP